MVVHFVCRGNAFRSIIAEAYLNSLKIPKITVISSGTVASKYKYLNHDCSQKTLALLNRHGIKQYAKIHYADGFNQRLLKKSDVIVLFNDIVRLEAEKIIKLPSSIYVWNIDDIGEKSKDSISESEEAAFYEKTYNEIVFNVDALVKKLKISKG